MFISLRHSCNSPDFNPFLACTLASLTIISPCQEAPPGVGHTVAGYVLTTWERRHLHSATSSRNTLKLSHPFRVIAVGIVPWATRSSWIIRSQNSTLENRWSMKGIPSASILTLTCWKAWNCFPQKRARPYGKNALPQNGGIPPRGPPGRGRCRVPPVHLHLPRLALPAHRRIQKESLLASRQGREAGHHRSMRPLQGGEIRASIHHFTITQGSLQQGKASIFHITRGPCKRKRHHEKHQKLPVTRNPYHLHHPHHREILQNLKLPLVRNPHHLPRRRILQNSKLPLIRHLQHLLHMRILQNPKLPLPLIRNPHYMFRRRILQNPKLPLIRSPHHLHRRRILQKPKWPLIRNLYPPLPRRNLQKRKKQEITHPTWILRKEIGSRSRNLGHLEMWWRYGPLPSQRSLKVYQKSRSFLKESSPQVMRPWDLHPLPRK